MRAHWLVCPILLLLSTSTVAAGHPLGAAPRDATSPRGDMVLWYRQPAEKWLEGMPLGNGIMGAMVFGGTQRERIALNECTFWSGRPHDYNDPQAIKYFPQIRDLVFAGKFQEAEKMADEHFWGVPATQQAFQPLGDLLLSFDGVEKAADYRRELDMETGVATVRYRIESVCIPVVVDRRGGSPRGDAPCLTPYRRCPGPVQGQQCRHGRRCRPTQGLSLRLGVVA